MFMCATVLSVQEKALTVLDHSTSQEVVVHTTKARCFRAGDTVRIEFNGIMTLSLPPQITANCIALLSSRGC